MLVWTYSLLQWNCMARSKNIGELAYHNCTAGNDFIKIRYGKRTGDHDGEKIRDKHFYANPFNPLVCPVLELCVWLTLASQILWSATSLLAVENGGANAPTNKYTSSLSQLLQKNIDAVGDYIWKNHANLHGLRKGSTFYAMTGPTWPSSGASISNRGDWLMGVILDAYWNFSKPGNRFLGLSIISKFK